MTPDQLNEALFAEEPTINEIKLRPFDFATQSLIIKTSYFYDDEDIRSRGISVAKAEFFILAAPVKEVSLSASQKPEKFKQAVESFFLEGKFTHVHIEEFLEWRNKVSELNEATTVEIEGEEEESESPN